MYGSVRLYSVAALLRHIDDRVVSDSLVILINLANGDDGQCQKILDAGAGRHVRTMLQRKGSPAVRERACHLLSIVAAGTESQISALMAMAEEIRAVILMAQSDAEWEVRREATWVLSNVAVWGNNDHVESLVEAGGVSSLCSVLTADDEEVVSASLRAIKRILDVGLQSGRESEFEERVYEAGGHYNVRRLTRHPHNEIRKTASHISNFRLTFRADRSLEQAAVETEVPTTTPAVRSFSLKWIRGRKG